MGLFFMADFCNQSLDHLRQFGYVMLAKIFDAAKTASLAERLSAALDDCSEQSVLRSRGKTYGSRNLLATFPEAADLPNCPALREFIAVALGPAAGIVRVLYFDKPPDLSWSLPWHKDRTIAVKQNDLPSDRFAKPTTKAGVPHVEAPESLLVDMLTLRIHLDPMTAENGPLSVIPGSHQTNGPSKKPPVELHADVGDVLAMKPLLSHASSAPRCGTTLHRRVIHIELAPRSELTDEYEWFDFTPLSSRGAN